MYPRKIHSFSLLLPTTLGRVFLQRLQDIITNYMYISFPAFTHTGNGDVGCQNVPSYAPVDKFTLNAEPHIAYIYLYCDEACSEIVTAGSLGTHL
jgi:hypothetical protein